MSTFRIISRKTRIRALVIFFGQHVRDTVDVLLPALVDARRGIEEEGTAVCVADFRCAHFWSTDVLDERIDNLVCSMCESWDELVYRNRDAEYK